MSEKQTQPQTIITESGISLPYEASTDAEIPHDCITAALFLSGIYHYEPRLSLGRLSFHDLCRYVDGELEWVGTSATYDPELAKQAQIISCMFREKGSNGIYRHGHFAAISKENPNYLLQRPSYDSRMEVIPGSKVLGQLGPRLDKLDIQIVYLKKRVRVEEPFYNRDRYSREMEE